MTPPISFPNDLPTHSSLIPPFITYIMSPSQSQKTVLITGANRGIGKGLLSLYLLKPNHIIIAFNRDPTHTTSTTLADLPKADGTSLLVVKFDATIPTDAADAVKQLKARGIEKLDVVIANAAIAMIWPKVEDVKVEDMRTHAEPNIYGFVWLYQAVLPLLREGREPMWVTIGSVSGFLTVSTGILLLYWR